MNKIIAFMMALYMTAVSALGFAVDAPDLEKGEGYSAEATTQQIELFTEIYETETAYLATMQLPNGALPMTYAKNGELTVNPYFADFAALALLDKAEEYADVVVGYMDWHFAHLNTAQEDFNGLDGTIYDYKVTMKNGEIVSEKISTPENADSYDTTDSYAATFLTVVNKYFYKTGDSDYLVSHAEDLKRITNVMFATLQNGLTYAKGNHRVKYLMDNCEVYEGFIAASRIFEEIVLCGKTEYTDIRDQCGEVSFIVRDNINNKLWNYVGGYYLPGITAYVKIPTKIFSWNTYYPQATSQLFPIICGVIEPDTQRAKNLYEKFCETYHWEAFDYPDAFYWGANVQAAAIMNDLESVTEYMENYKPLTEKHSWPLYNMDIARTAMAAKIMIDRNTAGDYPSCY
ncbi:MAG: hypothetical protein J6V06_07895 [Clostridia bacterium]|nr:hypothetical protein [Clostridia bacterium]